MNKCNLQSPLPWLWSWLWLPLRSSKRQSPSSHTHMKAVDQLLILPSSNLLLWNQLKARHLKDNDFFLRISFFIFFKSKSGASVISQSLEKPLKGQNKRRESILSLLRVQNELREETPPEQPVLNYVVYAPECNLMQSSTPSCLVGSKAGPKLRWLVTNNKISGVAAIHKTHAVKSFVCKNQIEFTTTPKGSSYEKLLTVPEYL